MPSILIERSSPGFVVSTPEGIDIVSERMPVDFAIAHKHWVEIVNQTGEAVRLVQDEGGWHVEKPGV